jgi:hypothetical protein
MNRTRLITMLALAGVAAAALAGSAAIAGRTEAPTPAQMSHDNTHHAAPAATTDQPAPACPMHAVQPEPVEARPACCPPEEPVAEHAGCAQGGEQ